MPPRHKSMANFRWQDKGKKAQVRSSVGSLFMAEKAGPAGFVCKFTDLQEPTRPLVTAVIPSGQTLSSVEAAASKALGFQRECQIHDPEGHGSGAILRSDAQLRGVLGHWELREESRSSDTLEAVLESIRSRLGSSRCELHYQAVHALWELSCRFENHAQIGAGLLSLLAGAVRSEEPHVAAVAAATAWLLSECDETRARLPMAELVPALLALATRPRDGPQDESAAQIRERRRRTALATRLTGRTMDEMSQWPVGALYSVIQGDGVAGQAGQRSLRRVGGELSLLPLLHSSGSGPALKRGVAALVSRCASCSLQMCSAILHGGAPLLSRMAAGWSTCDGWSARCQAAALLHEPQPYHHKRNQAQAQPQPQPQPQPHPQPQPRARRPRCCTFASRACGWRCPYPPTKRCSSSCPNTCASCAPRGKLAPALTP